MRLECENVNYLCENVHSLVIKANHMWKCVNMSNSHVMQQQISCTRFCFHFVQILIQVWNKTITFENVNFVEMVSYVEMFIHDWKKTTTNIQFHYLILFAHDYLLDYMWKCPVTGLHFQLTSEIVNFTCSSESETKHWRLYDRLYQCQ